MSKIVIGKSVLFNGDCLEVMDKLIKQGIKVDLIVTDPHMILKIQKLEENLI